MLGSHQVITVAQPGQTRLRLVQNKPDVLRTAPDRRSRLISAKRKSTQQCLRSKLKSKRTNSNRTCRQGNQTKQDDKIQAMTQWEESSWPAEQPKRARGASMATTLPASKPKHKRSTSLQRTTTMHECKTKTCYAEKKAKARPQSSSQRHG